MTVLLGEVSLVIPPLVSIQQQLQQASRVIEASVTALVKVCQTWNIPFLSLDEIDQASISAVIEEMNPKPRVILSTISRVSEEGVQRQLRRLPVKTICLDEVQVIQFLPNDNFFCIFFPLGPGGI